MTAAEVLRDRMTWAWALWVLVFFALEARAVRDRRPGGTLSELVWELCSVREKHKGWRWRRIALLGALAWLAAHLLTGWV